MRHRLLTRGLLVLLAAAPALAGVPAVAAQCTEPAMAPLEVTPAVGANGVTTDSWIMARYGEGYFGPTGPGDDPSTLASLERCGECGTPCEAGSPVRGHVEVYGDDLFFVPEAPLGARTQYRGLFTGLEGELSFSFCTGNGADARPPDFGQAVRYVPMAVGDTCELPGGGYRIGIYAQPADDDGPGGSLEYLLFLTRASGLVGPVLVDRVRNFSAGEITMRLFLDHDRAASEVCVRLGVVDGVGQVTMGDDEFCFDPVTRIAFQGCSVPAAPGARPGASQSAAIVACAVIALARRRRRAR